MTELVLFAKHWQPGHVKTRLARSIGAPTAAEVYRCCLQTSLERFSGWGNRCTIAFAPSRRIECFRALVARTSWKLAPQVDGDLGERMADQVRRVLSSDASSVILVGADSPHLPESTFREVQRAFSAGAEVVIGPSDDGGYYLLGLRRWIPELFREISWGSDQVFQQTLAQLEKVTPRPAFHALSPNFDLDCRADLDRLMRALCKSDFDMALTNLRQQLSALLP